MAKQLPDNSPAPEARASRRPRLPLSPSQLQAYLIARETLRRLKSSSRPCFARDPSALRSDSRRPPAER